MVVFSTEDRINNLYYQRYKAQSSSDTYETFSYQYNSEFCSYSNYLSLSTKHLQLCVAIQPHCIYFVQLKWNTKFYSLVLIPRGSEIIQRVRVISLNIGWRMLTLEILELTRCNFIQNQTSSNQRFIRLKILDCRCILMNLSMQTHSR